MILLLSLFCGAGGLDLGFEEAGFTVGLAFDKNPDSVSSYNHNRPRRAVAHTGDIRTLSPQSLDKLYGAEFCPEGLIGGPPCQSFSVANSFIDDTDPRHELPLVYARLLEQLNERNPVKFFVMENVPGLCSVDHAERYSEIRTAFEDAGFRIFENILDASAYETPQKRSRLFLVGLNCELFPNGDWSVPAPSTQDEKSVTVRAAIGGIGEPFHFARGADPATFPVHRNHWCMRPRSKKFTTPGALEPGKGGPRSFKTLAWDQPSITVAYGNREVHIHPGCHRRLSVYEAMRLQGFPHSYVLLGNLSSQISQVSEAVPPPLAYAVAASIRQLIEQLQNPSAAALEPITP